METMITEDERRVFHDLVRLMGEELHKWSGRGEPLKTVPEVLRALVEDGKITPLTEQEIDALTRKLEGQRPVDPRTV